MFFLSPVILFVLGLIIIMPLFKFKKWVILIMVIYSVIYLLNFFIIGSRDGMAGMAALGVFALYFGISVVTLISCIIARIVIKIYSMLKKD